MDSESSIKTFKRFDVIEEVAKDHYYLKHSGKDQNSLNYSKIMREWKILEKDIPERIYVQTYASRMDLLRAVIVGCAETPYHDALFFFDIALHRDYPNQPPRVYYRSHGYRVNPNLYVDGKVCISLLNNTFATKAEKWSKASTILQILVSIQGLVLNPTPYFNYSDYDVYRNNSSPKWVNASIAYNKEAFLLSWKTMLKIMRQPPHKFEDFVVQHFRGRKVSILTAFQNFRVSPKIKADLILIQQQLKNAFSTLEKRGIIVNSGKKPRKRTIIKQLIPKWTRNNWLKMAFFVIILTLAI